MLDKRKRRVGLRQSCCHFLSTNFKSLQKSAECSFFEAPFPLGVCCPHVFALLPPQPLPIMACLGSSRNRCGLRTLNEIGNVKTWHARFLFLIPSCFGLIGGSKSSMFSHLLMTCWTSAQPHHRQLTLSATWHATDSGGSTSFGSGLLQNRRGQWMIQWWRYHPTVLHAPDLASTCNTHWQLVCSVHGIGLEPLWLLLLQVFRFFPAKYSQLI